MKEITVILNSLQTFAFAICSMVLSALVCEFSWVPSELLTGNRYLGGAFDVESLVENLLGQLAGNQEFLVNVYDITNTSDPLNMYGYQNEDGDMSLLHESKLDFGDPFRKHEMICR